VVAVHCGVVKNRLVASGQPVLIEQSVEMQRPGRITVQTSDADELVHLILVSGRTIAVAEGRLFL
jgi:trans-2,3-dihydro-3-hydroxyanthranilate isomerase